MTNGEEVKVIIKDEDVGDIPSACSTGSVSMLLLFKKTFCSC